MIHNNKVYANADEKFVKGTIVYRTPEGMFHDEAYTKPVYESELEEMFYSGLILNDGDEYNYTALSMSRDTYDQLVVFYIDASGAIETCSSTPDPTE